MIARNGVDQYNSYKSYKSEYTVRERTDGRKETDKVESHRWKRSKCAAGRTLKVGRSALRRDGDGRRGQGLRPQLMCCALLYERALVFQRGGADTRWTE